MNQINIKKEVLIGVIIGLLATAIGYYFYAQVFNKFTWKFINRQEGMLTNALAYAVLPNLLAFFVFIKRKKDYRARGVMMATFLVAILIAWSLTK